MDDSSHTVWETLADNFAKETIKSEQRELAERLAGIKSFVDSPNYDKLSRLEREYLFLQCLYMGLYNDILLKRIGLFEEPTKC